MKNKKMRILGILLIILVLGAIVFYHYTLSNKLSEDTITASGTIEATEMDISPRVGGRIITLKVDEGDTVKKGEVIAVLDAKELNARVVQAQGAVLSAQAKLADLLKGSREEKIREAYANYQKALVSAQGAKEIYGTAAESHYKSTELKSNLVTAEANFKAARRERDAAAAGYALVKKGPREEDIEHLKAIMNQAKAQSVSSQQDYQRYAALYKEGAISSQQLDTSLAARDSLHASFEAAQANYHAAVAGSRPEEKEEARAKLAEADARLTGAKDVFNAAKESFTDRLDSLQKLQSAKTTTQESNAQVSAAKAELDQTLNGATSDEIRAAKGQLEQAHGVLAEAKSQLKQATLVAPEDGVVTVKSREVGEVVTAGTPIVRIANLENVWLRVYAPLPTLGKIKLGQNTSVKTDTYQGKIYQGRVASIKEEPEFTPKNVQTTGERVKLVYAVRININNKSHELKPGMPADAEIQISSNQTKRR